MPIPTHLSSCTTLAFKTACPACNEIVWFFSCTCGSKVYFDDLGAPWPLHSCKARRIIDTIEMVRSSSRMTEDEIYRLITKYEKDNNEHIGDDILEIIEEVIGKRKYPFSTSEVDCNNDIDVVSGMVMEFNKVVNLYRKYGYEKDNSFSKAFLGELATDVFGEITIREKPDNKNVSKEYKILVKQSYYKAHAINKNDFILGTVKVVKHGKGKVFLLTSHKVY